MSEKAAAKTKVTAYITRMREGRKHLLVFLEQDHEHLGYQVPGGTVEPDEPLEQALIREISEEAGIEVTSGLKLLGDHAYYSDKLGCEIKRYYYELTADCAESFTHVVQSNDEDNGWVYHYSWIELDRLPGLFGYLGIHLDKL